MVRYAVSLTHDEETHPETQLLPDIFVENGHHEAGYGGDDVHCRDHGASITLEVAHENDEGNHFAASRSQTWRDQAVRGRHNHGDEYDGG